MSTSTHALLTISEVSERTRTPVATLRYWRHLGTGPRSGRVGRRVVYRAQDVEAWLAEQLAGDGRPAA